jgi:CheY-like chemotaxis protein
MVMTDIQMPGMDGYDLAAQIIAIQNSYIDYISRTDTIQYHRKKRKCPIVAVTAYRDKGVF